MRVVADSDTVRLVRAAAAAAAAAAGGRSNHHVAAAGRDQATPRLP